jgi:F-box and WD-40 domain protein CDC4
MGNRQQTHCRVCKPFACPGGSFWSCVWRICPREDKLVSWSFDRTLRIWDIASGNSLHVLEGHSDSVNLGLTDDVRIISWSKDRSFRIWDIASGNSLHVLEGHTDSIDGLAIRVFQN